MHNSAIRSRGLAATDENGVPGSTRTSTERALDAFPLPLGYRHIEDQAGFEPAMGLSQRIKSPPRSAATVTGPWMTSVEDASGYDPLADGLKVRSLSIRV